MLRNKAYHSRLCLIFNSANTKKMKNVLTALASYLPLITVLCFFSCKNTGPEQEGKLQAATEKKRPNILFAISDDQSFPYASIYGDKVVNTPAFDRVAQEGVLFMNAFAASPGCSPSRAALLTGRNCWQIEDAGTHASGFPAKYVVYPDILEEAGYFVGYTGKGWGPGNWKVSGRERNPAGTDFRGKTLAPPANGISKVDYAGNFAEFISQRPADQPFCFWYGGTEPHRSFEKGSGLKAGKKLEDVHVPSFLPDTEEVRNDLLDYALEIEWFDAQLGQMIKLLEQIGELDNTIIVVTSDNGMAFPRAKASVYEYGFHVPLAIRWANEVKGGRVVEDLVSLIDLAPTYLEATRTEYSNEQAEFPIEGRSLMSILLSEKEGLVDPNRTAVYSARERHSSSRWNNLTYPQRALRTSQYLYVRNFKPERWPAGAPQKIEADGSLGAMHDAYHDIDACPTLDFLVAHREDPEIEKYFHLAVDKRPAEELFDIKTDAACLNNLAKNPDYKNVLSAHRAQLGGYLMETDDPRVTGKGEVYETYVRYSPLRQFPVPDWVKAQGELETMKK
jgi:N-sulfoglucosamine sulfohydrolase